MNGNSSANRDTKGSTVIYHEEEMVSKMEPAAPPITLWSMVEEESGGITMVSMHMHSDGADGARS